MGQDPSRPKPEVIYQKWQTRLVEVYGYKPRIEATKTHRVSRQVFYVQRSKPKSRSSSGRGFRLQRELKMQGGWLSMTKNF